MTLFELKKLKRLDSNPGTFICHSAILQLYATPLITTHLKMQVHYVDMHALEHERKPFVNCQSND